MNPAEARPQTPPLQSSAGVHPPRQESSASPHITATAAAPHGQAAVSAGFTVVNVQTTVQTKTTTFMPKLILQPPPIPAFERDIHQYPLAKQIPPISLKRFAVDLGEIDESTGHVHPVARKVGNRFVVGVCFLMFRH